MIFDNVQGYIRKYNATKYLALFPSNQKYETMFDRIGYLLCSRAILQKMILTNI